MESLEQNAMIASRQAVESLEDALSVNLIRVFYFWQFDHLGWLPGEPH